MGKNATQSSTYGDPTRYNAGKAVDGSTFAVIGRISSCSHTNNDQNAWWTVDVGYPVDVKTIYIYNRKDPNSMKLKMASEV